MCAPGYDAAGRRVSRNILFSFLSFFLSFFLISPFFFAILFCIFRPSRSLFCPYPSPRDQLLAGCQPCWPSGFDRTLATVCTRGKSSLPRLSLLCVPIQWLLAGLSIQDLSLYSYGFPPSWLAGVWRGHISFLLCFSILLLLSYDYDGGSALHKRIHHL